MAFLGKASLEEGQVGAGLDAILQQDLRTIGFASGVNFDQDYELEGIRTLGTHGDRSI